MAASESVVRLEEFTGVLQNKLAITYQAPDAVVPWLPTEFMPATYITRILIVGRTSSLSTCLAADPSWTQVWRSPGGREWSCLLGILPHLPGPLLIVIGPDVPLSPGIVTGIRAVEATVIVTRHPMLSVWPKDASSPDQIFFPVMTGVGTNTVAFTEAVNATSPRIDPKALLPQLAAQNYALTATGGSWFWYRPAESTGLATMSVLQIAKQLTILGSLLERTLL